MNKPILFIDEKPFEAGDSQAENNYNSLKNRLVQDDNIGLVEFYFENNNRFPFQFDSPEFQNVIDSRKLVLIHNSYPDSYDKKPMFPDNVIGEFKAILQGKIPLIRFSGNMYRRGLDNDSEAQTLKNEGILKKSQPLIEKDVKIERDDLYDNFALFIRHYRKSPDSPNYFILKYGEKASKGQAEEIEFRMIAECNEEYYVDIAPPRRLIDAVVKVKKTLKVRLKPEWKSLIRERFVKICDIAEFDQNRKNGALEYVESGNVDYPEYFSTVERIIKNEVKLIRL